MGGECAAFGEVLTSLAPKGVLVGHRLIAPGDEDALLPAEMPGFAKAVTKVRRQSGAARLVARTLLARLGLGDMALPRSVSGSPIWPTGIVGSMAHDQDVAVAAIASARHFTGLGIDVEPLAPLPPNTVELVTTPLELGRYGPEVVESRLLFVIKEAVYKAVNPADGIFLDFQDVEVDLETGMCRTAYGRSIRVVFATSPRMIALSFM